MSLASRLRPVPAFLLACLLPCLAACDRAPSTAGEPAAAAPALPAPATDAPVLAAMARFRDARAFVATMQLDGASPQRSRLEYVAPDRYRLQLAAGTQVIIGDTLYLQLDGRSQQVPLPAGLLTQWRDPLQLKPGERLQVEDLGSDPIGGLPAHRYRVVHPDPARPPMLFWIDGDGRPRRIEQQGRNARGDYRLVIDYTQFDDPALRIEAP